MDPIIDHPRHIQLTAQVRQLFILALVLLGVSMFLAYKYMNQVPAVETMLSYDTKMDVQKNREVLVTETIVYDFSYNKKKGISRYIPLTSMDNPRLDVTVLSVVDDQGKPYEYEASLVEKDVLEIKIGDPKMLTSGIKTYVINYRVTNAALGYKNFNEIYWNVTGDQWPVKIKSATATITLPDPSIDIVKMDCFTGPRGTQERSCTYSKSNTNETSSVFYSTNRPLMIIEGFTIFLDFSFLD